MKATDFHTAADLVRVVDGEVIEILMDSSLIGALLRLDEMPLNARAGCVIRSQALGELAPDICTKTLDVYRHANFAD
jgi:hypothetical protein